MRTLRTIAGLVAIALALGAALNTQAWECHAAEYWFPGVVLPAAVGAALLLRARNRTTSLDIGLLVLSLPLDIYAVITWAASICSA